MHPCPLWLRPCTHYLKTDRRNHMRRLRGASRLEHQRCNYVGSGTTLQSASVCNFLQRLRNASVSCADANANATAMSSSMYRCAIHMYCMCNTLYCIALHCIVRSCFRHENFFRPKCTKCRSAAGLRSEPLGSLSAPPDSLAMAGEGVEIKEGKDKSKERGRREMTGKGNRWKK